MGLFDIFKRKPGGTAVGNFLRGAVKNVPVIGSALGNGAMMITQEDADKRDLTDAEFMMKYGVDKKGIPSSAGRLLETLGAGINGAVTGIGNLNAAGMNPYGSLESGAVKSEVVGTSKVLLYVALAAAAVLAVFFIVKKK